MTERLLIADRADRPEHFPEAEPVTVETDGDKTRLVLDDGVVLDFDRRELHAATDPEAAFGSTVVAHPALRIEHGDG